LLDSLRAALDFRAGPTRTLLHHLKYRNRPELAFALGQRCAARFPGPPEGSLLVPVPITPKKKRIRGYNQAERFAAGLASVWGCSLEEQVLVRRIQHQSLTELDRTARLSEARNAFVLADGARNRFGGRPLLLVDDTLTTGATLGACAVALAALRPPFLGGFCAAWAP
jgi:predicted amidophosphoribosyltransferase